jgi:hypothetical protein
MPIDHNQVIQCLDEIEQELFRVADSDGCQKFHKDSQLTAVLLLILRASSLLRSMSLIVQRRDLIDGFHLVARGFEETWNIAHDLRLREHSSRAVKWLAQQNDSWAAKLRIIVEFAAGRGHQNPTLARDYGLLSELSHPTRSAAENSVTLCGVRLEIPGAEDVVVNEQENCENRVTASLCRLLWLIMDEDARFIPIPINRQNMPVSVGFVEGYEHIDPGSS